MHLAVESAAVDPTRRAVEVVERKGSGHPDTLCDAAAETFSRRLGRAYLDAAGRILHHNVDKALLIGGRTRARFGGGEWLQPIRIVLAGRATSRAGDAEIAVEEIGRAAVAEALEVVRHLDPGHVEIEVAVQQGSAELRELFGRGDVPRANDTSIGVGFAPRSPAEALTLAADRRLRELAASDPASPIGEDTKVMVVRTGDSVRLTAAAAMIAALTSDERAYRNAVESVRSAMLEEALALGFTAPSVTVNGADGPDAFYLTLAGTSAECGDDGQVGRGNRFSGFISPMRPMTLEAYAGKNPCTHVGKLLSVAATEIAETCARDERIRTAECVLVSQIGAPVSEPQAASVRLDAPAAALPELRVLAGEAVEAACVRMPELWRELTATESSAPA